MKREIKFRVRCQKHSRWEYYSIGDLICGAATTQNGEGGIFKSDTWSQFAGFRDKSGKEIYEGDILKVINEDGYSLYVECRCGSIKRKMDTGWEVEISCFYFKRPDGLNSLPIVNNYAGKHDLEIMEIVGNIYENPELIKQHHEK